ncbi:MAG: SIS domain-containing protein [bacterium]|nr:SIS domain-containing protein [bacterium]
MNLDDQKLYKKLDLGRVAESIESLTLQMKELLEQADLIKLPPAYDRVTQVVVNGMGGSNIGVSMISAALNDRIKAPITITPGYEVPASVDKNTLYLFSSYSGNTEEVLSVYPEMKKRGAKIIAICEQGDSRLSRLMKKDKIPGLTFKTDKNPSGQPRMGLGYSVLGVARLLSRAGLLEIEIKEIEKIIDSLESSNVKLKISEPIKTNLAKQAAIELSNKIPVIVGAEFLVGNLKIIRNQFNETSKNFACFLELPDMNHFALESLANPKSNNDNLAFFFIDSPFYHPRVIKRAHLTKKIVKKNGIKYIEHKLSGATKLEQAFEMLQFGSWVTYYLAMLNNVNPVKIPWVDWFKKELGE